jgi:ABC-type lipoprotein release transport system permease subunit
MIAATLTLAALAAVIPARRAAALRTADLLRAE